MTNVTKVEILTNKYNLQTNQLDPKCFLDAIPDPLPSINDYLSVKVYYYETIEVFNEMVIVRQEKELINAKIQSRVFVCRDTKINEWTLQLLVD